MKTVAYEGYFDNGQFFEPLAEEELQLWNL